ncbi:MAG: hypothetical protein H7175_08800 [Burkholderiales bacterium]|nr:hypothetical protein [Anaerolineae bacterium]
MKRASLAIFFLVLLVMSFGLPLVTAQTVTPSGPIAPTQESTIQIFFVACETTSVVNFSGSMLPGYDIFYQIFSGPGETGTALTNLRQVQVDGAYAFSESISYNAGATVPGGSSAHIHIHVARETNYDSIAIHTDVDDVQDGCNNPQNPLGTSIDTGSDPAADAAADVVAASLIQSPFGGTLNGSITITPEPIVVIGPRNFDGPGRTSNAGLVFAECDRYSPQADPGIVYDTDNVVIFWSWFAKTPEQIEQHVNAALYAIKLNSAPFPVVTRSEPERRGANYFTFYTVSLGNLAPGHYTIEYNLTWSSAISDGYNDFGPNTANVSETSTCNFDVRQNGSGGIAYNNMYRPG